MFNIITAVLIKTIEQEIKCFASIPNFHKVELQDVPSVETGMLHFISRVLTNHSA